jgi:hypothetical protein
MWQIRKATSGKRALLENINEKHMKINEMAKARKRKLWLAGSKAAYEMKVINNRRAISKKLSVM